MLELKNVSKFYYNKGVIASGFSKINLKLDMGEFVAITGESGSGKSTLLNVISGLDTYEEGEMYINGQETSHYSEKDFEDFRRKYISNIFQAFNLVNSYTVYQNIELVLLLNGYKKRTIKRKVIELIKKVDLYKFRNTKVSKLSGGQKQRVAIARALAKETPIIIADEPTGNLDKESAESVIKLLSEIAKDKLVIIVTHNFEQIEPYVTRKITMHDGRIIEDKIEKKIDSNIKSNEVDYKNITIPNRLRLSIRNTFNIKTKFILLFIVFLFIIVAISGQYASTKKQKYLIDIDGTNAFFHDISDNRIVIKKIDKTPFLEEDYQKIEQLDNVETVIKNDLLLDTTVGLTDGNSMYLYGNGMSISNFNGDLDVGRLPQTENEVIIQGYEEDYYLEQIAKDLDNTVVYLYNMMNGETDKSTEIKVVGIEFNEDSLQFSDGNKIYLSDKLLDKIRFQVNQNYSKVKVLFLDKYYNSEMYNPYFRVTPSANVPEGQAYVSRDLNNYTTNGTCINRPIKIEVENLYFKDAIELNISKVYNKNNIKSLLGVTEFDMNNGAVFINENDYDKLFNKETYQSSVYVIDAKKVNRTAEELEKLGFIPLVIKDTLVDVGMTQVYQIFQTIVTIVLIIVLFFITYFIIKIILKSRNVYFTTLRMLGANRKICKQLIIIELLVFANITYVLFGISITLQSKGIINIEFLKTILEYLKTRDYVILYAILIVMSFLISVKYARKLFKESSIKTYHEEV